MSEYRKTSPDDLYFVTLTVTGWIDLFTRKVYKDILVHNLHHCQQNEQLQIFSYVIMTNHLHMICRRLDADLNELLGRFKSYTSKQLLKAERIGCCISFNLQQGQTNNTAIITFGNTPITPRHYTHGM